MEYGLIGEKLGHSYSKQIHEQLIDNYTYELHPIERNDLDAFMKEKTFKAINVTIPYKQDVIPYCDELSDGAKAIGAVNTIVNRDGKLCGYNTDYLGFQYMLRKHNITVENKKVLVLGNGGASKAVQAVLQDEKVKELILVDLVVSDNVISLDEVYSKHTDCEVIINTTPVGMYPNVNASSIDLTKFKQCYACVDVIYNPLRTNFILQAQELGIKGIGGLEMLVAQAKYALEFFKDIQIDDSEIDKINKDILLETSNIILIGMPGSGKTTLAKQLAKQLNKDYIDIDERIVKQIKMPIADFFKQNGEDAFRSIESSIALEVSSKSNTVISTGGGIVKNKENIFHLKHNGLIFCVKRDLKNLAHDKSRPLSSSLEAVTNLYEERKALYEQAEEVVITNNARVDECVKDTIENYKNHIHEINK